MSFRLKEAPSSSNRVDQVVRFRSSHETKQRMFPHKCRRNDFEVEPKKTSPSKLPQGELDQKCATQAPCFPKNVLRSNRRDNFRAYLCHKSACRELNVLL